MPEIRLSLSTDATGAIKGIKQIEDGLEGVDKKAKKSQSTLDEYSKKVAAVFGAGAILKAMDSALKAQAQQEAAINKLNLALANQGKFTEATSAALQEYAGEIQKTTIYSDDAVESVMAMFASFGLGENEIKRATKATTDFAAATGKSLEDAGAAIAKASAGNVTALQKMGFHFEEGASKGAKFEAALTQIEQRFGGSAEAATATYIGQLKQLENAWGEAQEGLGKFLGTLAGAEKPFQMLIDAGNAVSKFFGQTLIIALGEARVAILSLFLVVIEQYNRLNDLVRRTPTWMMGMAGGAAKTQAAENLTWGMEMERNLHAQIGALREQSNAAALAAGNLLKVSNATRQVTVDTAELEANQKRHLIILKGIDGAQEEHIKNLREEADATKGLVSSEDQLFRARRANAMEAKGGCDAGNGFWATPEVLAELAANEGTDAGTKYKGAFATAIQGLPDVILRALEGGGNVGKSVGAHMGRALAESFQGLITGGLSKVLGPALGAALGAALPGIGAALGAVAGDFIGKFLQNMNAAKGKVIGALLGGPIGLALGGFLGGQAEHKRVNDLRDAFVAAAGGITELDRRAQAAGLTIDRMLNARTVKEYEAAIRELNDAFDLQTEAQEKLDAAIEEFGFTIEELGPRWAAQKLNERAMDLFEKYHLLIGAGIDYNIVIARMGPAINEWFNTALRAGVAIPEAWRGIIERMIENRQLLDENGKAYESLEATGITFTESLNEQFKKLLDSIQRLVNALNGIPNIDRRVTITTTHVDGPPPPQWDGTYNYDGSPNYDGDPNTPAASGWHGVVTGPSSGYRAPFTMHGTERVQITPEGRGPAGGSDPALLREMRGIRAELRQLPNLIRDAQQQMP